MNAALGARLQDLRKLAAPVQARWAGLEARERRLVQLMAWVLGLFLLWTVAVQPAWRTLRTAPPRLDELDAQLQTMQALAHEAQTLRAAPPPPRSQASAVLKAATERLGETARLAEQGERAVLTLTQASGEDLRSWLSEVRTGARARAVEVALTRSGPGLSGTVVVALPGLNAP